MLCLKLDALHKSELCWLESLLDLFKPPRLSVVNIDFLWIGLQSLIVLDADVVKFEVGALKINQYVL